MTLEQNTFKSRIGNFFNSRILINRKTRISQKNWVKEFAQLKQNWGLESDHDKHLLLHPCLINGKKSLVHERGLAKKNSALYVQLDQLCKLENIHLQEDRRTQDLTVSKERRKTWVTMTMLSLGLFMKMPMIHAEESSVYSSNSNNISKNSTSVLLGLFSDKYMNIDTGTDEKQEQQIQNNSLMDTKNHKYIREKLFKVLHSHYKQQENDPAYVVADLKLLADYYSRFPESSKLLLNLDGQPWNLSYQKNQWSTRATGNHFSVLSADVFFDTRAAAQLHHRNNCKDNPQCIISPADALLHELLHASSMLLDTDRFISQGGMNSLLYPTNHEMWVIKQEKGLYKTMANRDGIKRPQRSRHTGRMITASCVTCIN